ncbi:helix-turn-helix domain-containing protein [Blastochloris tepida]|uniref:Uncharacterized protein n=1 Tax=Blastochloris tepida TaxID=2233851 RepID=A0A348FYJ4_9HYPH|nr:helix-turn-helix domain-containing protein [Blastochloris tepida]BBF92377.1 hypothetical protein BLTE_10620 [Blastochloris tepida]
MSLPLPGVLAEIAAVTDEATALRIAMHVGGLQKVYFPAQVGDDHWLIGLVGRQAAEAICAHFAVDGRGQRLDIPLAGGGTYQQMRRTIARRVHELDQAGASSREIARQVGLSQRRVHAHRAAHRGHRDKKQGELF